VEGAEARLVRGGTTVAEARTDNYGDFKFDKLDQDSGCYVVEISVDGSVRKAIEATLGASINLGEIRI
jgi:hypothetical protein